MSEGPLRLTEGPLNPKASSRRLVEGPSQTDKGLLCFFSAEVRESSQLRLIEGPLRPVEALSGRQGTLRSTEGPLRPIADPLRSTVGPLRSTEGRLRTTYDPFRLEDDPLRLKEGPLGSAGDPFRLEEVLSDQQRALSSQQRFL